MALLDKAFVGENASEEEEDYMSMAIEEPAAPRQKETYTQRRRRKEREAEARGRVKSKAERAAEEAAAREDALAKSMLSDSAAASSKGLAMMAKMGFTPGKALGKGDAGRIEPVGIFMKEDRSGIGLDSEKKRKFREEYEDGVKRGKAEEGEYRERVRRDREDVRLEGLVGAAMRVAERMAGEKEELAAAELGKQRTITTKPLKQINVLWRGLVRRREEKERDRRMRYDLHQSLSRLPTYDDPTEDAEDRRALGKDKIEHTLVEDLEEEDPDLDEFNELEPVERLRRLVEHLRKEYYYCFFCKYTYPDEAMEGCPGLTEEDHD
ncbi:MAG: hypothetical protein M1818_001532 [Claussenomyces sp. TS43310]|nr:MAG: hypothetical protein M1818_001532 [Claussenomyces sp. TS43310]